MQDGPTAPELLNATSRLLHELVVALPPERRFGVVVAAHTCAMLAREFECDDESVRREAGRLVTLLGQRPDRPAESWAELGEQTWKLRRELARRVRAGELDDRFGDAIECVRASVRDKLRVTHPGYTGEPG